jgi:hypothetical protein
MSRTAPPDPKKCIFGPKMAIFREKMAKKRVFWLFFVDFLTGKGKNFSGYGPVNAYNFVAPSARQLLYGDRPVGFLIFPERPKGAGKEGIFQGKIEIFENF